TLASKLTTYQDNVDGLRAKAGEIKRRVSQRDKDLVEEKIKISEKKYNELRGHVERLQQGYQTLKTDLGEVRDKVDQYLTWLNGKEEEILRTKPEGYNVEEAERKLERMNLTCTEMENRQPVMENISQMVDGILQELTPHDRVDIEQVIRKLQQEHERVYELAVEQRNKLKESLNEREIFLVGFERIKLWLDNREKKANKMEKMRLSSSEVEKQAEKVKNLMTEIINYQPNIQQLLERSETLKTECVPEIAAELEEKCTGMQNRYEMLKNHIQKVHERLRDSVLTRKTHESEVQKVERWCKETEIKIAIEPSLDCATEILQDQYQEYEILSNTAHLFRSLVKEISDRALTLLPDLHERDVHILQQQTQSLENKQDRLSTVINERLRALEEAIETRSQVTENIQEAADWLAQIQQDLRDIPRAIGHSVEDAEDNLKKYEAIAERIANYQPTIAQLNQAVERLRNAGQKSDADEILQLTSTYEMLSDQVAQHCKKSQQAVASRQDLHDGLHEMENLIKECEDEIDGLIESGDSVPVKTVKLKAVVSKVQNASPAVFKLGDKAQQIGIEGTAENAHEIKEKVQAIRAQLDGVKKIAGRKAKQCETIQRNRDNFEATVNETMSWLEQKEQTLASCTYLDLEPEKVTEALKRHQALSRDALDRLDALKIKAQVEQEHFSEMEEPLSPTLNKKLEQIHNLEETIKETISKKEQYITEAKADRMQLEASMKQISDWIHGAEELLDSGYEGLDYDTLNDTLSEYRDYFSEASMCQDEMDQVMELSERILSTLDVNDKETLRQSLINTNQKLAEIVAASHRKQQLLESRTEDWKDYQLMIEEVSHELQTLMTDWRKVDGVSIVSPAEIKTQLADTKDFIEKVQHLRPIVSELNEKAVELDKDASSSSHATITQMLESINSQFKTLVSQTENNLMTLQDLDVQYEDFHTLLQSADLTLCEAEQSLSQVADVSQAGYSPQLMTSLAQTKTTHELLEVAEPKIKAMRKCGQILEKSLPTAEAKVHVQEVLMAKLEKFERIQDKVKEHQEILQEEIEDREGFNTEADHMLKWLHGIEAELQQLHGAMEVSDVMERIDKLRLAEQEIVIRMEQMRHLAQLQETKYKTLGKPLPEEIREQMAQLTELESHVTTLMKDKEEELLHLRDDRRDFDTNLKVITTWLKEAELQLQERISDIPESIYRHEHLQSLQSS
ncbi:hypothetical protein ACJMK2_037882, partial [Sinanodonta woodiana]